MTPEKKNFLRMLTDCGLWPAAAAGAAAQAFPIGSVFIAVVSTDPATLLGYGTWTAFGAGKVLVGVDGADADFNSVEKAGGAKTVASSGTVSQPAFTGSAVASQAVSAGTPAGTVSRPTLAMDSYTPAGTNGVPTFTGNAATLTGSISAPTLTMNAYTPAGTVAAPVFTGSAGTVPAHTIAWPAGVPTFTGTAITDTTKASSGSTSVAILASPKTPAGTIAWPAGVPTMGTASFTPAGTNGAPAFTGTQATLTGSVSAPALTMNSYTPGGAVTAPSFTGGAATLTGTVSQPTFTGSALGTHAHNVTAAGTVSQPTFTGDAQSVVQPYITVYLWKRTA